MRITIKQNVSPEIKVSNSFNKTDLWFTQDIYLWFSHGKDQLLHTPFSKSRFTLLVRDHHEIITVTSEGNHRMVRIRDQDVLKKVEICRKTEKHMFIFMQNLRSNSFCILGTLKYTEYYRVTKCSVLQPESTWTWLCIK